MPYTPREDDGIVVVVESAIGVVPPVVRVRTPDRVPVVLSRDEVGALLEPLTGMERLVVILLYGAGLPLEECLELRVKDLDFDRQPAAAKEALTAHQVYARAPACNRANLRVHTDYYERRNGRWRIVWSQATVVS